jgi:hypothetical protein
MTLLSKVSPYYRHAKTAVKTASSVSTRDALEPLVCCKSQAKATGPITTPVPAMAKSLSQSRVWMTSFSLYLAQTNNLDECTTSQN